jgi:phosphopantothenoylcysteine decarboxylase/phosphopantothenate--cysteine ligase
MLAMKSLNNLNKVLITAGPTREPIDPVRYITNHSSGKMGYAIADAFLKKGFEVILVSGPVNIPLRHDLLTIIPVITADEMFEACLLWFSVIDIAVFTAAVADYKPAKVYPQKMKKSGDSFTLAMVKNVDIALEFGKIKNGQQVSVGFALETNNEQEHALAKIVTKNLDMVILNSLNEEGAAFGFDTNKITLINRDLTFKKFPLKTKTELGVDIAAAAARLLHTHNLTYLN